MSGFEQALVAAAWLLAPAILVLGIDDLFIDLLTHVRNLFRSLTVYRRQQRATAEGLSVPGTECPIVILVPAWREDVVIGDMLRRLRARLDYGDYRVFVGVYPNDPATRQAVAEVSAGEEWLIPVLMPCDGPTSKADCLNRLYLAALAGRAPSGRAFEAFVIHDAEDLIDPLECRVFSALIGRADMIQLPVVPILHSPFDLVSGHYLDEFAETHQKDMILREALTGGVPCAGVGCAFTARALRMSAAIQGGRPFPDGHMTEDYSLSLRLKALGLRTIFVRLPAGQGDSRRRHPIATRGYFPDLLGAAIRQKTRWLIGIGLQSWREHGWPGGVMGRLMLYRDRKALFAPFIGLGANILVLLAISHLAITGTAPRLYGGESGPLLEQLIGLNLALFAIRAGHRAAYVAHLHGLLQAVMSLPRMVVGNIVNSGASARALWIYARHRLDGRPLLWDKTAHLVPLPDIRNC